ncbi:unannotated protein [freshwater metagenome]|uniref:Unannotated protein n=1 Tax=freshwater metagenome TaxID=449393 RepID=A0A6J7JMD5_9ZZZZ
MSPSIASTARPAASPVHSAKSVATWSLRERAVCRRAPGSPTSSVRWRSIAMWMSSSSAPNGNVPSWSFASIVSKPERMAVRSSSPMMPRDASIRAWAREPRMSCGHMRRS